MPKDFLAGVLPEYDVVVIGSGLAGMTSANILGRAGHRVLLLEQHYKLGGLATWFKRPGSHIFDISLHGFPFGMIKSCRRYWNEEIAIEHRPAEEHSVRQPDVLADNDFQSRRFYQATDVAIWSPSRKRQSVLRRCSRNEFLR